MDFFKFYKLFSLFVFHPHRKSFFTSVLKGLILFGASLAYCDSVGDRYIGEWWWGAEDQMGGKYEGSLKVKECRSDSCEYDLTTGSEFRACASAGRFQIQSVGIGVDKIPVEGDDGGKAICEITFSFAGEGVTTDSEGQCNELCGLGANFGGDFSRVSKILFYPTSFNCYTVKTKLDLTICANEELALLDKQLSEVYESLRLSFAPNRQMALREEQKKWLRSRNSECSKSEKVVECLVSTYSRRLEQLK